jgi:hypothetical protein
MRAGSDDRDHEAGPELGAPSIWLLRITAVVFLTVLGWFLVDAIIG